VSGDQWRPVLDAELKRWSEKPWEQLVSELAELQVYEVQVDSKTYQVEVEILENRPTYVQVAVAVDDGTLPASIRPLSKSFVRKKE
jgi:hypothetical protein